MRPALVALAATSTILCAPRLAHASQGRAVDTLRYELEPLTPTDTTRDIRVRLTFRSRSSSTPIRLRLPSEWAGWNDLHRAVQDLESASPNTTVERTDDPTIWTLRARTKGEVAIRYRIHQDWSGPIRRPEYFRAIAEPQVAVLLGQNALIIPDLPSNTLAVTFTWQRLPEGWRAATSFGSGLRSSATTTARELRDAMLVAGAFRWSDTTLTGRPMTVAVFGTASVSDSMTVRMAASLLAAERAFWSERPSAPFLVVRVPVKGGLGGTAFTNAIAMYSDSASRPQAFGVTLAHELFHAWIGHGLAIAGPEGVGKWFTEGFTEFYADRFAFSRGMFTHDEFLDRVNRTIRDYYMSPVRNAPNDSVAKTYWTDPAMNRFPYQQGYLVAGYLDARTRDATSSKSTLDSALRTLMRAPRLDNSFTTDDFISAFPAAARADVRRVVTDFVRDGQTVPVLAGGFDRCTTADTRALYRFDLGFDAAASMRDRRVSGVRPGSPADSAGLRNGQTMRGWSWNSGDTDNPVVLSVADSGAAARRISYLARGATMDVPQLVAMVGDCDR